MSQRAASLSSTSSSSEESRFLHAQISALLERSRQAPTGSYLFERLEAAIEDLLDAGENILGSRGSGRDRDDERQRIARDLERTYFRIQQGDYFARQSQEGNAAEYILTARRLYQVARAAFDARDYRRARQFAEASRNVISALESLAQAAVPIPDPPALP